MLFARISDLGVRSREYEGSGRDRDRGRIGGHERSFHSLLGTPVPTTRTEPHSQIKACQRTARENGREHCRGRREVPNLPARMRGNITNPRIFPAHLVDRRAC